MNKYRAIWTTTHVQKVILLFIYPELHPDFKVGFSEDINKRCRRTMEVFSC